MTFEVKLLITFVATDLLVILTKFGRNPVKHVGEEANCEKEERRKKERKKERGKKSQERNKLGGIPPNLNSKNSDQQAPSDTHIEVKNGNLIFLLLCNATDVFIACLWLVQPKGNCSWKVTEHGGSDFYKKVISVKFTEIENKQKSKI